MIHHIAVDIGASSGRLVHGVLEQGKLRLHELHRFANGFQRKGNHDYWDIEHLFQEIITGLGKAKQAGIDRCTLGVDTWAVDYVLLDEAGERLHDVYAYRDARTNGAPNSLHQHLTRELVYSKTGIQELTFNTLYQLYVHDDKQLGEAAQILYIPDYLYYRLTEKRINEATNASTSQMINLETGEYDEQLLELVGVKREQFAPLTEPGTLLGPLLPDLQQQYDLPDCQCIVVPTHDTASAVVGVPVTAQTPWAYISSGTWSLLGMELTQPLHDERAMKLNYTNERGAYNTYRFLKNIMGMWMIQEARRLQYSTHSFSELVELAAAEQPFQWLVRCNDARFLNPNHMVEEIQAYCRETEQSIPQSAGEIARTIFDSLALTYYDYMHELEQLTGMKPEVLHIVGGGANNGLLCQLTADLIGREVKAGPTESTAIGNLAVQLIACGKLSDLSEARQLIADSFEVISYQPNCIAELEQVLQRWRSLA